MIADEWAEENGNPMLDDDQEPDYDDRDDDDYPEPDPEDAEIARAYEEEAEHRETVHGGGECTCRPSLRARASYLANDVANRLTGPWFRLKAATRHPLTVRVGPAEITIRLRAGRPCGACGGQGWAYSLIPGRADMRPAGYNDVGLCGCGSAIGKLADTRRYLRSTRGEPPF